MKRRWLSLLLAVIMVLGVFPTTALAAERDTTRDQVHVIVENTTYPAAEGAAWDGTLADTWVDIDGTSSMMSAIGAALTEVNAEGIGLDTGYISSINGLAEFDGGGQAGWMGTLNDWFVNAGFSDFTVAAGTLVAGDTIRVMYSRRGLGADLGQDFNTLDNTSLSDLSVEGGTLNRTFASDTLGYTVTVPAGTTAVTVNSTAANKGNNVVYQVGDTQYRRSLPVPVANGTEIRVICGTGTGATTYSLLVQFEGQDPIVRQYAVNIAGGSGFTVNGEPTVAEGSSYSFTVSVEEGYDSSAMSVSVNGTTVEPDADGVYTVADVASDLTIAVTGLAVASSGEPVAFMTVGSWGSNLLSSFRVYSYENGEVGSINLLSGVEDTDPSSATCKFETLLPAGDYLVEGYDNDGNLNGSVVVTVSELPEGETNEFYLVCAYTLFATNDGWVCGTDYSVDVRVTAPDGTERTVGMGEALHSWALWDSQYNQNYPSAICLRGDTVTATYTPSEARAAEGYIPASISRTLNMDDANFGSVIPMSVFVNITVPDGSDVDMCPPNGYMYTYAFIEPVRVTDNEDETTTFTFQFLQNSNYLYRARHEGGVTYWASQYFSRNTDITLTADDLYIGSSSVTPHSVWRYENNLYDRADLYMNINGQGSLNMNAGETRPLNIFRSAAAANSGGSVWALPEMHYTVIDENGAASDVVSVTPDEQNSGQAVLTANHDGTAIVLVTYDALTFMNGQSSTSSHLYSATWPEATGVFVVTVGAGGAAMANDLSMDRLTAEATPIDAEHDILYYFGEEGASFTCTPEAGAVVSVARPVIAAGALTYAGFSADGVTANDDGTVTISALMEGRNILRFERDGLVSYQVITARQAGYQIMKLDGGSYVPMTEDEIANISAGDTIYLQFSDLLNPAEALFNAYSYQAGIVCVGEDGTTFTTDASQDFSWNPAGQLLEVTIPRYFTGNMYTLHGVIRMSGGSLPVGGHREAVAYGSQVNWSAVTEQGPGMILSEVPEIVIPLAASEFHRGTLFFVDEDGNPVSPSALTRVTVTDSQGIAREMDGNGYFVCAPEETYSYEVYASGYQFASGTFSIDHSYNAVVIELRSTSEGAWDGVSVAEPAQDENGVYQITNGAELAWFGNQFTNNSSETWITLSGVLLNDIDLAGYEWTPIGNSDKPFTGTLDGAGHAIHGLSIHAEYECAGLIGYADVGATIRNLTLYGSATTNEYYLGSFVGYASGDDVDPVVVENCVSYVNVTSTDESNRHTGGIVGWAESFNVIDCANHGDITGATYVGGIMGYGRYGTVTGSYNTGTVTGESNVGGILGMSLRGMKILSCYNMGSVTASGQYAGGIEGRMRNAGSEAHNIYNTGTVSGSVNAGSLFGVVDNAAVAESFTNAYYLEGAGSAYGTALSEEELQHAALDSHYFRGTCGGYPALVWQTDVTFHHAEAGVVTAPTCTEEGYTTYVCEECGETYVADYTDPAHTYDEGVVTAPTCTEEGYTTYTCTACGESYTADVTEPLGHTPDETKTVDREFYTEYTCAVCGETYRVYHEGLDERIEHMTLGDVVESISFTDANVRYDGTEGTDAWAWDEENSRIRGITTSSQSIAVSMTIDFTLSDAAYLSFDYGTQSFDWVQYLQITGNYNGETEDIEQHLYGVRSGTYAVALPAGDHSLTFTFNTEGESFSERFGYFSNFTIESMASVGVTIANGDIVMHDTVAVRDLDADGTFTVDEALYAAHEAAYDGGAAAGYATAVSDWGLGITKLWGVENGGSYGYYLNNESCNSLSDEVTSGDDLTAFIYTQSDFSDSYAFFDQSAYTFGEGVPTEVMLQRVFYDGTAMAEEGLTGVTIIATDRNGTALTAERFTAIERGEGRYLLTFAEDGEYQITVDPADEALVAAGITIVPPVADVTVGNPIDIHVTVANAGEVVVAQESVTMNDLNGDGAFDVDEALVAVHDAFYDGGAAAGYAAAETQWGLSVAKLWGVENGGSYGYYLNNAMCMGLTDTVEEGDYLYAYVFADPVSLSDSYGYFDSFTYATATGEAMPVTLQRIGFDESWNMVTIPVEGASFMLLDENGEAVDEALYQVADLGEGSYTVSFRGGGTFRMVAMCEDVTLVPAVAEVTVSVSTAGVYKITGQYLQALGEQYPITVNSVGGEWMVLGLARSDMEIPDEYFHGYYDEVVSYVREHIDENERLHWFKATDNERVIIALTALGYDVTNVAGHNLLAGLDEMSYIESQGLNSTIWALIAFDCGGYETPADSDVTREALVQAILDAHLEDGGWALSSTTSDVDMTAMAVQALAPYYEEDEEVKAAVDAAVAWLSAQQQEDGTFVASGYQGAAANSESTAQVIVALTALGIDPASDERFVKNGVSAVDALCSFFVSGGGFKHVADAARDGMATEQGFYALAAYYRFRSGKTALYDMSDVERQSFWAPEISSLTATAEGVTVDWNATEGAKSYIVMYREVGEDDWTAAGKSVETSMTVTGLTNAVKYEFVVIALTPDLSTVVSEAKSVRVPFKDVTDETAFYYDPVYWALDGGITTGWDDGTFRPWNTCNRAAVVTFLWRMAGCPAQDTSAAPFTDMTGNADFDQAIIWAVDEGITTGWSDGTFRPWNTCNRAAIVTFLWRAAGKPEASAEAGFTDMTGTADFDAAIAWAVENGIATGYEADNTFRPWANCNRAATVTFMWRLAQLEA